MLLAGSTRFLFLQGGEVGTHGGTQPPSPLGGHTPARHTWSWFEVHRNCRNTNLCVAVGDTGRGRSENHPHPTYPHVSPLPSLVFPWSWGGYKVRGPYAARRTVQFLHHTHTYWSQGWWGGGDGGGGYIKRLRVSGLEYEDPKVPTRDTSDSTHTHTPSPPPSRPLPMASCTHPLPHGVSVRS